MKFFGQKKYTYLSGEIFSVSDDEIILEYIEQGHRRLGIWNQTR